MPYLTVLVKLPNSPYVPNGFLLPRMIRLLPTETYGNSTGHIFDVAVFFALNRTRQLHQPVHHRFNTL
jgi:hypothetical protein